jgi:hypothetical protein
MRQSYAFSIAFVLAAGGVLTACGDTTPSGPGAPMPSGSAKPTATATAATTAAAATTATAAASAMPSASASAAAVQGIAAGEMVGGSCDTISADSECMEFVVTAEAEKAKSMEALKKLCKGTVSEKACAADKMVGTCREGKDMIKHYYGDGPKAYKAADDAKKACEKGHGKWATP